MRPIITNQREVQLAEAYAERLGHPGHSAEVLAALTDGDLICEWFAMCTNTADRLVAHPVLGAVPSCGRCQTIGH